MTVQEQLQDAASSLNYDDLAGGAAICAFRGHLRIISENVPELEAAGYTVQVNIRPERMGGGSVKISRNGQSVEIYSVFYDRFSIEGFKDWQVHELKRTLGLCLQIAKLFNNTLAIQAA